MKDTLDMPVGVPPVGLDAAERRILAGWMLLAVGSLAAAGVLALMLALARSPGAEHWFPWPWETFFRKALVTHVVMAFVVWFLAMLGGLAAMARPGGVASRTGLALAVTGTVLLLIPALANQGQPLLVDYVPVLSHPIFYSGLLLLAAGVALPILHLLARPPSWGLLSSMGIGTAGVLFLLALLCFALAATGFPAGERFGSNDAAIFWGGGHLLQLVYTTLLLTVWQILGEQQFGKAPLSARQWQAVCLLLLLSGLPGPVFYGFWHGNDPSLRQAFTRLYWIGLPLPIMIAGAALFWRLLRNKPQWRSPGYLALLLSFATFAAGGVLGLFADGTDTRTPGHYHAEIVGVTLAFMGLFFAVILPILCRGGKNGGAVLWQFWLLGGGQLVACSGLFLAGSQGVGRKIAGAAQGLDSFSKTAGVGLNAAGGAIAVVGGVLFVYMALSRLLARSPKISGPASAGGE
jgi:cytochrome c oxidase subunit 1